jgi:chromosome segregation protein
LAEARNKVEQIAKREAQAREALAVAQRETETAAEAVATLQQDQKNLPDLSLARAALTEKAEALTQARGKMMQASAAVIEARQARDRIAARIQSIGSEIATWESRIETRGQRMADLAARIENATQRLSTAGTRPDDIARELTVVMSALEDAEQTTRVQSDALIRAETDLAERRSAARAAEKLLALAREDRVRAESSVAAALEAATEIQARTQEKLNISAEELSDTLALEGQEPDRAALETKLASLTREREAVGPVNLRAEIELEETSTEIAKIEGESNELSEAIARLRQAIGKLNGEARERLVAAFEVVRVHFKRLFVTLFGGGDAELALTNMDDPLEAGLEIYASPPGKKLQSLSLLSGGEQALTALSLLFAMFLATPAPVCVLDEVDAPLDDANVTRFCDLLDEISAETGTRFLVITHHRVTMARMDRLYGVTMAERGVSMLVSVDLRQAELFADTGTQIERALATA